MATTANIDLPAASLPAVEEPAGHAAGAPAILGLPIFAAGSVALGLVVVALVLLIFGTLNANATLNELAGDVVLAFAALGLYLFLSTASTAPGGRGVPLGAPLQK